MNKLGVLETLVLLVNEMEIDETEIRDLIDNGIIYDRVDENGDMFVVYDEDGKTVEFKVGE